MTYFSRLLESLHPLYPGRYWYLILQMARREVDARYRGSVLGIGWSLLYPLLILAAYTFVFRHVFNARWPGALADSTAEFALQVFAGLLVFNLFADILGRGPRLVLEQPNLVKRVRFPIEILPWVILMGALFHATMALVILLFATAFLGSGVTWWILMAPLVVVITVPVLLGLAWLLGGIGVFVRDIGHAMGPAINMLLFLSPVLYPAKVLPSYAQAVLWLNPLTIPIENLRRVVLEGREPEWLALTAYGVGGLVFSLVAFRIFERIRPAFADEL